MKRERSWMRKALGAIPLIVTLSLAACGGSDSGGSVTDDALAGNEARLVFAIDDSHRDPDLTSVVLISLSNGETIARLSAGHQAWAAYRPSTQELLISDLTPPDYGGRLRIFNLSDTESPVATIPMPDRSASTIWAQAMILSNDERYLYYSARTERVTYWIGVIDLNERREVARPLLPGCGSYVTLGRSDDSDALAFCRPDYFAAVAHDGVVSEELTFPLPSDGIEVQPESSMFGNESPIVLRGCSGLGRSIPCQLQPGELALAYSESGINYLAGIIVYSEKSPSDFRRIELPDGITYMAPLGATTVVLLDTENAKIHVFDLEEGEVVASFPVPAGTEWLAAV